MELFNYSKQFNKTVFLNSSPVIDHRQLRLDYPVTSDGVSLEIINNQGKQRGFRPRTSSPSPLLLKEKGTGVEVVTLKQYAVLTIGWIGFYNAHRENLMTLFFPALLQIKIKIKLVLLGVTNPLHKQELKEFLQEKENIIMDIPENIDWLDEESVYEKISGFDIGISPLIDNNVNRAKSAFKLKQYLSCGVPILGSRVGENMSVIQNGVNGFFCETPEDYVKMIHYFNQLPEENYRQISINAKLSSGLFSMDKYCDQFVEYCNSL